MLIKKSSMRILGGFLIGKEKHYDYIMYKDKHILINNKVCVIF